MTTQTFFSCFFLALACSIISVTVIMIMAKEPILNWWFRIGERYGKRIVNNYELERWFYRPIWGCEKCFAGQLALWSYLAINIGLKRTGTSYSDYTFIALPAYNFGCHILTVCMAILTTVILSSYITKTLNSDGHN